MVPVRYRSRACSDAWSAASRPARAERLRAMPATTVVHSRWNASPAASVARSWRADVTSTAASCDLVLALFGALRAAFQTHTNLALENWAPRQQLALLRHRSRRPRFSSLDRTFWLWLSQWWTG